MHWTDTLISDIDVSSREREKDKVRGELWLPRVGLEGGRPEGQIEVEEEEG